MKRLTLPAVWLLLAAMLTAALAGCGEGNKPPEPGSGTNPSGGSTAAVDVTEGTTAFKLKELDFNNEKV